MIRQLVKDIMKESDTERYGLIFDLRIWSLISDLRSWSLISCRASDAMFRTGIRLRGGASHFLGEIIGGDFQGQNGLIRKNQTPMRWGYYVNPKKKSNTLYVGFLFIYWINAEKSNLLSTRNLVMTGLFKKKHCSGSIERAVFFMNVCDFLKRTIFFL